MGMPIPVSQEASALILAGLEERGIAFYPETVVTSLDPATHQATLRDGGSVNYDLFLGVPVHRAPVVVEESGIAVDGWVPVDHTTFATRFPNVFACGDVTSDPRSRSSTSTSSAVRRRRASSPTRRSRSRPRRRTSVRAVGSGGSAEAEGDDSGATEGERSAESTHKRGQIVSADGHLGLDPR